MGGFFGIASQTNCIEDLFFGTDYHSHLGPQLYAPEPGGSRPGSQDETDPYRQETEKYNAMENRIRKRLNLTTLKYQRLEDLVEAIGLPGKNCAPIVGVGNR